LEPNKDIETGNACDGVARGVQGCGKQEKLLAALLNRDGTQGAGPVVGKDVRLGLLGKVGLKLALERGGKGFHRQGKVPPAIGDLDTELRPAQNGGGGLNPDPG